MPYTRAFSSLGCPEASLEDVFALAARHDIPAVELRALGGTIELPAYLAQTYGSPAALAPIVARQPVKIAALDTGMHLIGNTREERDRFLDFIPWAEALGVPWLRVFDGGRTGDGNEIGQAAETFVWWQELRAQRGWQTDIMVETHDSLTSTPALRRLLAAVPACAILWDSHHTWKRGGEDPVATWEAIKTSVVHVHVKDSVSVASARHPFTYVAPGTGEFPMEPLAMRLRAEDFVGVVSLEWERMWHPYLAPVAEALQAAAKNAWW